MAFEQQVEFRLRRLEEFAESMRPGEEGLPPCDLSRSGLDGGKWCPGRAEAGGGEEEKPNDPTTDTPASGRFFALLWQLKNSGVSPDVAARLAFEMILNAF